MDRWTDNRRPTPMRQSDHRTAQPPANMAENEKIAELDQLVHSYLQFRQCDASATAFVETKKPNVHAAVKANKKTAKNNHQPPVADRILAAFDDGDYPLLLSLWETFIVQPALDRLASSSTSSSSSVPSALEEQRKNAEFLCNLHCAIYPFRADVMRRAGSPDVAATVAARAMTIFKHFMETRGHDLIHKGHPLHKFRGVHKIAFPPTHPNCKELFASAWVPTARDEVRAFLDAFLASASPSDHLPALYKIFLSGTTGGAPSPTKSLTTLSTAGPETGDADAASTSTSTALLAYKEREEKLVRFSQAIIDITSDLLRAIEAGGPLDSEFMANFKEKFDYFRNALPGGEPLSASTKKQSPKVRLSGDDVDAGRPPARVKDKEVVDASALRYDDIAADLHSKVHEVENYLAEAVNPTNAAPGADDGDAPVRLDPAVKAKYAVTSATQASLLACHLARLVVRPDKDLQPKAARDAAVSGLVLCDILGIVGPSRTAPSSLADTVADADVAGSPDKAALDGSGTGTGSGTGLVVLGSRLRNEGVLGYVEALRSYLRTPPPPAAAAGVHEAALCLAESLFRLVTALGSSAVGATYLRQYGFDLTAQTVKLLAALPASFSLKRDGSVLLRGSSSSSSSSDRSDVPSSAQALSSTRLWCQMALIVLTGAATTDTATATASAKGVQTLTVRHGGLEWLTEALQSLLLAILAAAYATHPAVLAAVAAEGGGDEAAVGAAALALDAAAGEEGGGVGGFSITDPPTATATVPQELLTWLDVTLGLLFVSVRAPATHRLLVSTAVVQAKAQALLQTLVHLVTLPHVTKTQADLVLLTLTVLVRHEAKLRALVRTLPAYTGDHARRVAKGGLKWWSEELGRWDALVASDEKVVGEGEGEGDEVAAAASDVLGTVGALQVFVADNAQLAAAVRVYQQNQPPRSRQLSFVGGVGLGGGGGGGGVGGLFSLSQYMKG